MPPNNTIVARLTADPRDMQRGLIVGGNAAEEFGTRVERVSQRVQVSSNRMMRGGTNAALAFNESARLFEDASVGFQLNGVQGAIRGSLNNIGQMALLLGGPMTAAITTFAAVGLGQLVSWWLKSDEGAKDNKKSLDSYGDSLRKWIDIQTEATRAAQEFAKIDTAKEAAKHLEGLQDRLGVNRTESSAIASLGNKQQEEQLHRQFDLTQQRLQLEKQIEASKAKQASLAAQERQEAENELARRRFIADVREKRADAGRGQSIIEDRMRELAPDFAEQFRKSLQIRELENLNLPPQMQDQLAAAIAARRPSSESPFASFVDAGSQEAAKLDFQDTQRAKDREIQQKIAEELKGIHETLEDIKEQNTPVVTESINLDG